MSETKMSLKEVKIEYPGTKPLNVDKATGEIVEGYTKIAEENVKKSNEIQGNKLPPIVSEKAKKIIINTVRSVLGAGMIGGVAVPLVACKGTPVEVEEKVTAPSGTIETISQTTETVSPTTTTTPETSAEIKKVDAPEIKGQTFSYIFNQENKTYVNEKTGEIVGILLENAYKKDGIWQSAIGLNSDGLRKILNENKEKGIFKPPLPFDFKKDKGIEIVELVSANGGYKYIGIKYKEPISLYAASDCVYGYKFKYIPQENDSFSSQDFSGSNFSNDFEVKNRNGEIVSFDYEVEAVDFKPLVELDQPWLSGRWEIQEFSDEIKIGQLIGQLLPSNSNYSSLDFRNRPDWYENPDHCQASLWMNIFGDKLDVKSDLDEILSLGEKDKGIKVFVWSGNSKTS